MVNVKKGNAGRFKNKHTQNGDDYVSKYSIKAVCVLLVLLFEL